MKLFSAVEPKTELGTASYLFKFQMFFFFLLKLEMQNVKSISSSLIFFHMFTHTHEPKNKEAKTLEK